MEDSFKSVDKLPGDKFIDPALYEAEKNYKVRVEQAKFPHLPPKYIAFTVRFRCFWILINFVAILASAAMATGTILVLGKEHKSEIVLPECSAMSVVCWALFMLHICNFLFSSLAICGLEKRICITQVLLALMIFDGVVLIWAHATYFKSQSYDCNILMPDVYLWLMGEILFFYILTAFIVCYFFRKFCQDPAIKAQVLKEQAEEEAAEKISSEIEMHTIRKPDIEAPLVIKK